MERYDGEKGGGISPRLNFDEMYYALITIFCLIVNEDWNQVLYTFRQGYSKERGSFAPYAFLMIVVLFGNFFLLQTFLALLIGNF